LVVPEGGLQPHIERLLRATKQDLPESKRILEINPKHRLILNLYSLLERSGSSGQVEEWIDLLFEQALLAEGSPIRNPAKVAKSLSELLRQASEQALAPTSS